MDKDFTAWKMAAGELGGFDKNKFSFMTHPYILNPATKAQALYRFRPPAFTGLK